MKILISLLALALPLIAGKPNIVLIYCDDLGYADLSCQGAEGWRSGSVAGELARLESDEFEAVLAESDFLRRRTDGALREFIDYLTPEQFARVAEELESR